MNMKDKIEHARNLVLFDKWHQNKVYLPRDITDAFMSALPSMVVPLVWKRSILTKWNGDYQTYPAAYAVRDAGGKGWKLSGLGEFVYLKSPEAAFEKAQEHHVTQIMAAFGVDA